MAAVIRSGSRERAVGCTLAGHSLFAEQFPEGVRLAFSLIGLPIGKSLPPVGTLSEAGEARLRSAIEALISAGTLQRIA
jgi:4-hydroxy-tetrahydrodipicolinate synthase